jgi:hypothetical protein
MKLVLAAIAASALTGRTSGTSTRSRIAQQVASRAIFG